MTNEQDKVLPWLKWFTKDAKNYREVFSNEQMGELFFAAMKTVENNEKVEVSNEIRFAYLQLCTTIEEARSAYLKKCEINRNNRNKGSKAKTAKAKAKKDEFKPPNKTDFRNMAKHICREYDIENYDQYTIDNVFDELAKNHWCFNKNQITSKAIMECVVYYYLTKDKVVYDLINEAFVNGYINQFTGLNFLCDELLYFYDWDRNSYRTTEKEHVDVSEFLQWFFSDEE